MQKTEQLNDRNASLCLHNIWLLHTSVLNLCKTGLQYLYIFISCWRWQGPRTNSDLYSSTPWLHHHLLLPLYYLSYQRWAISIAATKSTGIRPEARMPSCNWIVLPLYIYRGGAEGSFATFAASKLPWSWTWFTVCVHFPLGSPGFHLSTIQ